MAKHDENIAQILADAEIMGDEDTAKKHGISERSVRRYRQSVESKPALAASVLEKRRELSKGWLEAAKQARMVALTRGMELVQTTENLRDVAGFLKIVHDAVLADEMLGEGEGSTDADELDRRSDGLGGTQEAHRQVQGIGTTAH
jgi:hypothetical protein